MANRTAASLGEVVERVIARCGTITAGREPPVDPFKIARALGADVVERSLTACEAMLVRASGRMAIVVDSSLFASPSRRTRLRFTLAHELAHLIVDDVVASQPRGRVYVEHADRERLCDVVASNLLIPRDSLSRFLRELQNGPNAWEPGDWVHACTALRLRRQFQVSLAALGAAIRELSPMTAILKLDSSCGLSAKDRDRDFRLRIIWSSPTSSRGDAVFRGQALNADSPLGRAAAEGKPFLGESPLSWRPLSKGTYTVSGAPAAPSRANGRSYLVTVRVTR